MFNRIKDKLASVAYAGLKPTTPGAARSSGSDDCVRTSAGKTRQVAHDPASSDPLYLTNHVWQKMRPILVISVPILVLLGGLGLGLANILGLNRPYQPPPPSMSNAEVAQEDAARAESRTCMTSQHDVNIQDVTIPAGSMKLQGIAKNLTDHEIHHIHVVFDLTDKMGSQQSAVSTDMENIAAKTAKPFQFRFRRSWRRSRLSETCSRLRRRTRSRPDHLSPLHIFLAANPFIFFYERVLCSNLRHSADNNTLKFNNGDALNSRQAARHNREASIQ